MDAVDSQKLHDIAHGAAFLGSGGGGTLSSALKMIEHGYSADKPVRLLSVEEAMGDDSGVTVSATFMGSQTAGKDVTNVDAVVHAVERLNSIVEQQLGKPIRRLVPMELGVQSSVVPAFLAAQKLGLGIVDADGAGRSVMGAMLTTYAAAGLNPNPAVAANHQGSCAVLEPDVPSGEDPALIFNEMVDGVAWARAFGVAGVAVWPMQADDLNRALPVRGTLELARRIGVSLRTDQQPGGVLSILTDAGLWARVIFRGKVESVATTVRDYSTVTVAAADGVKATVLTAGESVIAFQSNRATPIGMGPDSLCWMTKDGQVFSNTEVPDPGTEVLLVGIASRAALTDSKKIMYYFRYFQNKVGYGGSYLPIQQSYN